MTKALIPLFLAALLLPACQTTPPPPSAPPATGPDEASGWRTEAEAEDVIVIENVQAVWRRALENADKAGLRRRVAAEGRLLDPDAALPFPAPSPGYYMCRALKFAPAARNRPAFVAYKPFFCFVGAEDERLFLTKQTGSERPSGYIWPREDKGSMVFLGSMADGEAEAVPYGADRKRDIVGIVERVGPLRFRLVIPRDVAQGRLDIFELVPAPVQNDE